jgi:Fur family ferric uptake transcriptional regulator
MSKTRRTDQRRILRKVLEDNPRPLSIQEVFELGRVLLPNLGIATVYRNIKDFTEKGFIRIVDVPGGAPRYEMSRRDHHHHFHCGACDRLFDVPHCSEGFDSSPEGYDVLRHDVFYYGRCPECAPPA